MANTWDDVNLVFDIRSENVDVNGLAALKGSDPASTDGIYVSETYRVTVNRNMSCKWVYLGDNQAGDAGAKTGHLTVVTAGAPVTLLLYDTVIHGGLTGEGSTSTITLTGESNAVRAIIDCNTADKVTNYGIAACKITSLWSKFNKIYCLFGSTAAAQAHDIQNTVFNDCMYAIYMTNTYKYPPAFLDGSEFIGCGASIYDLTTTVPTDWLAYFVNNKIKLTGDANGHSQFGMRFGTTSGISRFIYCRTDAASMQAAPAWTAGVGIASLTANANGTLSAAWGAAAHGTGDAVRFRIYVRAGAAPDAFGVASEYYLGETDLTTFLIACDAAGAALAAGTAYHVIVRAATALSAEDTNTTALSATATLVTGKTILQGRRLS